MATECPVLHTIFDRNGRTLAFPNGWKYWCLLSTFKQRLHDICIHDWHTWVEVMSCGRLYIGINYMSNYSLYLDKVIIRKQLISLSRLRMTGHRLGIEMRRWHRPAPIQYEERKCIHCKKNRWRVSRCTGMFYPWSYQKITYSTLLSNTFKYVEMYWIDVCQCFWYLEKLSQILLHRRNTTYLCATT